MKTAAVVVIAVLAAGLLTGCSLKMGNTQLGLFEGWNQPTSTQTQQQTSKSEPVSNQK